METYIMNYICHISSCQKGCLLPVKLKAHGVKTIWEHMTCCPTTFSTGTALICTAQQSSEVQSPGDKICHWPSRRLEMQEEMLRSKACSFFSFGRIASFTNPGRQHHGNNSEASDKHVRDQAPMEKKIALLSNHKNQYLVGIFLI